VAPIAVPRFSSAAEMVDMAFALARATAPTGPLGGGDCAVRDCVGYSIFIG
jgi:hypothetical protein